MGKGMGSEDLEICCSSHTVCVVISSMRLQHFKQAQDSVCRWRSKLSPEFPTSASLLLRPVACISMISYSEHAYLGIYLGNAHAAVRRYTPAPRSPAPLP